MGFIECAFVNEAKEKKDVSNTKQSKTIHPFFHLRGFSFLLFFITPRPCDEP